MPAKYSCAWLGLTAKHMLYVPKQRDTNASITAFQILFGIAVPTYMFKEVYHCGQQRVSIQLLVNLFKIFILCRVDRRLQNLSGTLVCGHRCMAASTLEIRVWTPEQGPLDSTLCCKESILGTWPAPFKRPPG
eukprot:356317-Chlamydomonas_euryale.AAC.5